MAPSLHSKERLQSATSRRSRRAAPAEQSGNFYRSHVCDDLATGALVEVLPPYSLRPKTIYAILPHVHMVRPLVRAFTAFISEEVRNRLAATQRWPAGAADTGPRSKVTIPLRQRAQIETCHVRPGVSESARRSSR